MSDTDIIIRKLDEINARISEKKITVSIPEAAEILSLGESKLKELLYQGKIPSIKVGSRRLIRREALREWAEREEKNAV